MREDESHLCTNKSYYCATLQGKSTNQSSLEYCISDSLQDSLPTLSSLPASPGAPSGSKASSFLEYSQLGRLSVGWQDSPDIVALFLSGQLEKCESITDNVSFFDNDHEALFIPPEFEMKTSFMFMKDKSLSDICMCSKVFVSESNPSPVVTESINDQFKGNLSCVKCHKMSLTELKQTLEQMHIDVKMSCVGDTSQGSQEVDGMDTENSYVENNSQCLQLDRGVDVDENSCANASEFSNGIVTASNVTLPVRENLFSTTIISAPEIADSSTQLPFSPLTREPDANVKHKSSCRETGYDIDSPSSLHTASTPSKTSKSNYSKGSCQQQQHFTPTPQSSSGRHERSSGNTEKCDPKDKFPYIDRSSVNPFDSCTDSLQMPTVSPSLFKEVISPHSMSERSADFRWSIEQIALLNPAHIELTSPQSYCDTPHDLEYEKRAQEAIEKFFSRRCVLPSPWTNSVPKSRFTDQSDRCKYNLLPNPLHTPRSADSRFGGQPFTSPSFSKYSAKSHNGVSVACQTTLSFPAVLPPHVESLLALHSQSTEVNTTDGSTEPDDFTTLNNTSLRRRLLFSSEEAISSSPSLRSSQKISEKNASSVASLENHVSPTESTDNNSEPSLDSTVVTASGPQKFSPQNIFCETRSISPIDGNIEQSSVDFEFEYKEKGFNLRRNSRYGPICSLSPTNDNGEHSALFANRNPVLPSSPHLSPITLNASSRHSPCSECKAGDCWCSVPVLPSPKSDSHRLSCGSAKDGDAVSPSKRNSLQLAVEETPSCESNSDTPTRVPTEIPSVITSETTPLPPVVGPSLNYDRSSPINHSTSMNFKCPSVTIDESHTLLSSNSSETISLTASSAELCFVSTSQCSHAISSCDTEPHSVLSVSQCSTAEYHSFESTTNADGMNEFLSVPGGCEELRATNPSSLSLPPNAAEASAEPSIRMS